MATNVLYRKSSGEVLKVSLTGQMFADVDDNYFDYMVNPTFTDGTQNRENLGDTLGPIRQFGFQKTAIPSAGEVRNSTQAEIDTFSDLEQEDGKVIDVAGALAFLEKHPRFRKIFAALLKLIVSQLLENSNVKQNAVIDQWNQFKVDIGNAASLGDIKTSVAALPTITSNLPETATLITIRNQLKALINKDD